MPTIPTFDVLIAEAIDGYTIQVQTAFGVGELPPQPFMLPLDLRALPQHRNDIAEWIEQARIIRRSSGSEELRRARALGTALFEHLFSGELLAGFRESRKAVPLNEYLRVRLRLPAALVPLPWELLFDPRDDQFLALAPDLVLVRYPEMPTPVRPLHLNGPLRVVVVAASPSSLPPLNIERELLRIMSALKGPVERGQVALDILRGPDTLGQLRTRLRDTAHVVHFLGHGDVDSRSGEGILMFEDIDSAAEPINAELLRVHLQKQRGQTQLVVLNACLGALPGSSDPFSSVGAALLRAGVPAVIAMQFAIPDDVAIDLARVFYAELAAGTPVDLAVNETRMQLYGRNPFRLDWVIPVLFLRATNGVLFERAAAPYTATSGTLPHAVTLPPPVTSAPISSADDRKPRQTARNRRRFGLLLGCMMVLLMVTTLAIFLRGLLQQHASTQRLLPFSVPGQARATPEPELAASPDTAALPAPRFPTLTPTLPPLKAIDISNTPGRSENAQIAVDTAGVVHTVWLDNTPRQGKSETVLYHKMTPDGAWSEVEDLTPNTEYVGTPYLVANLNRDVCLVIDSVLGIFTRCLENGSWSPLANPVQAGIRNVFAPALGADRQPRWLSGLNGLQFAGVQLDDGLAAVTDAQFVIDSHGNYHAVWGRQGNPWSIEYRFSDDEGKTWQQQQRLTAPAAQFASDATLLADSHGAVHLVWAESGKKLYRKWTAADGWREPVEFGTGGFDIALATDSQGRPVAVWAGDCEVRYARQMADERWSSVRVLNANASPSLCATEADIAIDERGRQHIVWVSPGNDGERDVYYAALPEDK